VEGEESEKQMMKSDASDETQTQVSRHLSRAPLSLLTFRVCDVDGGAVIQ